MSNNSNGTSKLALLRQKRGIQKQMKMWTLKKLLTALLCQLILKH